MKSTDIRLLLQGYVAQWMGKIQLSRPVGERPVSDLKQGI